MLGTNYLETEILLMGVISAMIHYRHIYIIQYPLLFCSSLPSTHLHCTFISQEMLQQHNL